MRAGRVKQASGQPPSTWSQTTYRSVEGLDRMERTEKRQTFLTSLNLDRLYTKKNLNYLNAKGELSRG